MIDNPFDISKDGNNLFIDGLRFHIRNSEILKQEILNYLKYIDFNIYSLKSDIEIYDIILNKLNIKDDELIIANEHEILDWIHLHR